MVALGLLRTPLACALAGAIAASLGGCAGEPFSNTSDAGEGGASAATGGGAAAAGAASGGRIASGGADTGGANAKGGSAGASTSGGSSGSAGAAEGDRGGSAGSANGGTGGPQAGNSSSGGALATGGTDALPDIPTSGLALWLAADRGVTLANGVASKWLDQSPNHADATQVAAASRPKPIKADNGLPLLEFDGKDDYLALPEGFANFSAGLTFFAVAQYLEESECAAVMQFSNDSEVDDIDFGRFQGALHYEVGENYVNASQGTLSVGPLTLLEFAHDEDEGVELRMDGQFMTAGEMPLPSVVSRVGNFVGRSLYRDCSPLKGSVAEILFYSRPLGQEERLLVEQYLSKKWGCCSL